jgi:hypothetical protein
VEEGYYDLEITGDGGFSDSHRIYLQTMPLSANLFGMVVMDLAEPHAQFGLLDGGGALKNPYPVFEIRLKSRITYWRYRSSEGKILSTTPKSAPFLTASAGQLVSVNPRSMTASPSEFQVDDPNTPNVNERIFLPNPNSVSLRQEADGRIYSDVFVPKIKDLINVS